MSQDILWAPNTNSGHVGGPVTGTDVGGGKRGLDVNIANTIETAGATYATRLDEASSTVTYIGLAEPGSAASAAAWQIKKIEVIGTETIITFADGNSGFDNIWADRASLSYS